MATMINPTIKLETEQREKLSLLMQVSELKGKLHGVVELVEMIEHTHKDKESITIDHFLKLVDVIVDKTKEEVDEILQKNPEYKK